MFASHFPNVSPTNNFIKQHLFPLDKKKEGNFCQNLTAFHHNFLFRLKTKEELWSWLIQQGKITTFPFVGYGIISTIQINAFKAQIKTKEIYDLVFKDTFIPICSFPNTRYTSNSELILVKLVITKEMAEQAEKFKEKTLREAKEAAEELQKKKELLTKQWAMPLKKEAPKNDETLRVRNLEKGKTKLRTIPKGHRTRSSLKRKDSF